MTDDTGRRMSIRLAVRYLFDRLAFDDSRPLRSAAFALWAGGTVAVAGVVVVIEVMKHPMLCIGLTVFALSVGLCFGVAWMLQKLGSRPR